MQTGRGEHSEIFRKCAWRLIPFILVVYFINYVDRVNVGFAALTMNQDLGFSPAVFGFGAGIFFLGYFLFQVPGNLIMQRVGARRWMFSIMLVWGLISAANAFIQDPTSFYVLRFALGVEEHIKIVPCVGKNKEDVKKVLLELLYTILERMDTENVKENVQSQ